MRTRGILAIGTAAALVTIGLATSPAQALAVSNTTVRITAPSSSPGPFQAKATIRNTGTLSQPRGSIVTLSATRGTISNLPAGCAVTGGKIQCRAGWLYPGQSESFAFTVTPTVGATSVFTSATGDSARPEFNVGSEDGDFDGKLTRIPYSVTLDLTSAPAQVRHSDDALLTAKVTNGGLAQSITLVVATGNTRDTAQSNYPAVCGASDSATVTCTDAFAAGETKSFDIAVVTPATGTSLSSSASATGAVAGSASDAVTTPLFDDAQAFVPEGEQLSSEGVATETTFTVPEDSAPGLLLELNEVTLDEDCGGTPCYEKAAEALFPNDGTYSGHDVNHPFVWEITYNVDQTCDESGESCLFNPIFLIPSGSDTAVSMPKCSTFERSGPPADPVLDNLDQVCLNFVTWTATSATYQVALLRDIVIPIIGGVRGQR
ncbi:MAG: hypothetical protein QOI61_151 [Actinomycetota bacterium]